MSRKDKLIVDGIKILEHPFDENYCPAKFEHHEHKFLRCMQLDKNTPVRFDMDVVMTPGAVDSQPRKDIVEIITLLLTHGVPVYIGAYTNLQWFQEAWNKCCVEENHESFKAVMIPDYIIDWYNVDCIGITNRIIRNTQSHFIYKGNCPSRVIVVDSDMNRPAVDHTDIITVSNDPFIL